jgi:hypothetical protein
MGVTVNGRDLFTVFILADSLVINDNRPFARSPIHQSPILRFPLSPFPL